MAESTIGEQELALLRHVADAEAATVGEVVDTFGRDRELAQSTVLTMMERLRKKGTPAPVKWRLPVSGACHVGSASAGRRGALRRAPSWWVGLAVSGVSLGCRRLVRRRTEGTGRSRWRDSESVRRTAKKVR